MSAALADMVSQHAAGALAAQRFIDAVRTEKAEPRDAFDRLIEIVDRHGLESPTTAAFVAELAKRATR